MLRRQIMVLCFVVIGTIEINAAPPKVPAPPKGFQWVGAPEMGCKFLQPDGWYVKKEKQADTEALFITKENIETEGKFTTGLAVNVIPSIRRKKGMAASQFMARFAEEIAKGGKVLLDLPPKKPGRITSYVLRTQHDDIVLHHFLMADDRADKLYVVYFESPVGEWESNKKYWEPLLGKMIWEIQ